jgi:hypothetical protein
LEPEDSDRQRSDDRRQFRDMTLHQETFLLFLDLPPRSGSNPMT